MINKIILAVAVMLMAITTVYATTYYSRSSGQWNTTTRWNTARDGSGSSHDATWTGNHIYYIQNGHAITRPGTALGSTSSSLVIEDGGSYTHGTSGGNLTFALVRIESNATFTANATGHTYTTFTIYGGGKYIHNTGSNAIPGGTRNFANSTNGGNGNGTVEIQNQGTSNITAGITWGNVIINNTTTTQAIGNAAAFADVQGDFKVVSTNGYEYRFMSTQTTTHTIKGDLLIEGGILVFKSSSGDAVINVDKSVKISGGSLTLTQNGGITLNVKEHFEVSSGSFLAATTATAETTLNLEGKLDAGSATNFRAYNASSSGAGYLTINFTNTQSLNRASELKLKTGYDRYHCKWNINIKSGRKITLGSDIEMGTTNNSSYSYVTFTAENGSTLVPGSYIIKNGSGTYNSGYEPRFTLSSGANIEIANTDGITTSGTGAVGAIQVTGTRSYNSAANYTYNGVSAQVTGNGIINANNLVIDNSAGVSLSGNVAVNGNLSLVSGALNLNSKTLTVNGTTTVTGGSFSGGSPATDGYENGNIYLSIAANDQNITGFSASTAVENSNYPAKIKRQWTINGTQTNNKTITFSWTTDDDNDFNWTEKVPSVFANGNEYAGDSGTNTFDVSGSPRTITVAAPISSSKADWKIGLKGGEQTLPIELSSFTTTISAYGTVQITWVTQSETNVMGFKVLRAQQNDLSSAQVISPLISATNTSNLQTYVYQDTEPGTEGLRFYWLNHVDMDGTEAFHGPVSIEFYTDVSSGSPAIPLKTGFETLYPNPFNPSVNIAYQLAVPAEVKINIYNSRGQLVKNFGVGAKEAGRYRLSWNGMDDSNRNCGSGLYLFEMVVGRERFTKKACLLK